MKLIPLAVAAVAALLPSFSLHASVRMYTSRAAFNAAAPGLPVDTFPFSAAYQPYPLDYYFHTRPVSSATNDGLIPAGSIFPGVTITTLHPLFESQALKLEPGGGAHQIGAATFEDVLVLEFDPPVSAVGFDVSGRVYTRPLLNGSIELGIYNGNTLLSSSQPTVNGWTFVGFTSSQRDITRVELMFVYDEDSCTFISNLAFNPPPPPPPPCPADFNADGFLDFFDLDAFTACFEGDVCPQGQSADFNHDGFVDFFDLDAFIGAFEQGC